MCVAQVAVVYLLCALNSLAAGEVITEPFLVIIDNYEWRHDRKVQTYELMSAFMPDGSKPLPTIDVLSSQPGAYQFNWTDKELVTGLAYCVNRQGDVRKYRFRTMPNEQSFHEFVKLELKRRGDSTQAHGSERKLRLSNPPPVRDPDTPRHVPLISWVDTYWAWENGILVWGDGPHVHDVVTENLTSHVRAGRGRDGHIFVDLSTIPDRISKDYLQRIATVVGVQTQKRDAESATAHRVRKAFGDNIVELLPTLRDDVTSMSVSFDYPEEDSSARGQFLVNAGSRSRLARLLRAFRSGRSAPPVRQDGLATAQLRLGIPEMFRPGLHALVANSAFANTEVGDLCNAIIDDGTFLSSVQMAIVNDVVWLTLTVQSPIEAIDAEVVAPIINGAVTAGGTVATTFDVPFFNSIVERQQVLASVDNGELRLAVPLNQQSRDLTEEMPEVATDDATVSGSALLAVDATLIDGSPDSPNPAVEKVLRQLEQMFQHWLIYRYPRHYRLYKFRTAAPDVPITSLVEKMTSGSSNQFRLRVEINSDGTQLTATGEIGRDLFGWLKARDLVSRQSIHSKSER